MTFTQVLAQATVRDLVPAEAFYATLFGRAPDTRPMPGLLEWHFGETHGVQVFEDPDRAGRSSIVIGETDLDELAKRLVDAGVEHSGLQPVSRGRVVFVTDADGNRIVFTGE